jgi:hypothetical protein
MLLLPPSLSELRSDVGEKFHSKKIIIFIITSRAPGRESVSEAREWTYFFNAFNFSHEKLI